MFKAEWTNKDSLDLQQTCNKLAINLQQSQICIAHMEKGESHDKRIDYGRGVFRPFDSNNLDSVRYLLQGT